MTSSLLHLVGTINGGDGNDTITVSAAAGAVNINGGSGNNTITANAAATITGGNDVDTIYLKAGGSVDGGAGADKIYVSGSGAATIKGGDDADTIDASAATGAVTIEGGAGNDTISLGSGADVVKFTSASSADANTITNFTVANDKLSFDGTVFAGSKSATDVTTATNQLEITANKIYVGTKANIQSLKGASSATNNTYVAVVTSGDGVGEIYAVADTNNSATATTTLIGTIDNVENLAFTNFGFFTA